MSRRKPKNIISRKVWESLPDKQEYLLTPGGYRHQSNIHKVSSAGKVMQTRLERPVVKRNDESRNRSASNKFRGSAQLHFNNAVVAEPLTNVSNPHWVAYSNWVNTTGKPVFSIRATWRVPPAPETDNGQTIFIFPGMQSAQRIVQPVLQWGTSAAGGGSFWSIASWYAGDPVSHVQCSDAVPVNSGDEMTGVITLRSVSNFRFSYSCVFEGQETSTVLSSPPISELLSVCLTLESYNISIRTDYPSIENTLINSIEVNGKSGPMSVQWETPAPLGQFGEHAVIESSTGGVEDVGLFY